MKLIAHAVFIGLLFCLSGCSYLSSFLPNKSTDYRTLGSSNLPPLEVPPDLTSPNADDRYLIPDSKSASTSSYSRDSATNGVLPKIDGARIERVGEQRWLVVKSTPDKVWIVAKEFWLESGFLLKRETPESGIMETDWAENRGKIPQDIIRNSLGKYIDGAYSTPERDKFRTRLEAGSEPGTTDVYISHRGVEEVFNKSQDATLWQPRASDRDLEVEMLGKLMVRFAAPAVAPVTTAAPGNTSAVTSSAVSTRATYDDKSATLKLNEPFDRAWRTVGLALDRVGFTVEDRDRSKGLYFVRYIDPDADVKSDGKSFWDKLMFWRTTKEDTRPQYRVAVVEKEGKSDINVQDVKGVVENSSTTKRILNLLLEQLK